MYLLTVVWPRNYHDNRQKPEIFAGSFSRCKNQKSPWKSSKIVNIVPREYRSIRQYMACAF